MGGTGVAVAHPSAAPTSNPAMMASEQHDWADDFGLMLPSVNARLADEEEVVDQIDDIQDVIDNFDNYFDRIDSSTNPTPEDVAEFQNTAGDLNGRLNAFSKDTMRTNVGLGVGFAIPTSSVSVGVFANGNLTATVRGELDDGDSQLLSDIADASTASDVKNLIDNAETDQDGNLKLDSRGRILASAVAEVGISLATTFDLNNDNALQVGVSPKYVELQTFQYTETVSGFEDDDFDSDQYQTDKSGFNLDIGAAYAFGEDNQWNTGVVVKNIIPMELDSAQARPVLDEKRTFELNPMVTAGIAHKSDHHVLTAELDLTKKEAFGFEDDTQWLAVGAEFDAWRWAQLRAGVRHNLASNDDNDGIEEDTQFTAGLGLNFFGIRMDIGGLYSSADVGAAIELGSAF
ncbi:MAG: conjugal transfer protein TraF [Alteromonadaceae bacterium]|nr:conjugal transfer protein TraF [Alteromonadaceae bacterium]